MIFITNFTLFLSSDYNSILFNYNILDSLGENLKIAPLTGEITNTAYRGIWIYNTGIIPVNVIPVKTGIPVYRPRPTHQYYSFIYRTV